MMQQINSFDGGGREQYAGYSKKAWNLQSEFETQKWCKSSITVSTFFVVLLLFFALFITSEDDMSSPFWVVDYKRTSRRRWLLRNPSIFWSVHILPGKKQKQRIPGRGGGPCEGQKTQCLWELQACPCGWSRVSQRATWQVRQQLRWP